PGRGAPRLALRSHAKPHREVARMLGVAELGSYPPGFGGARRILRLPGHEQCREVLNSVRVSPGLPGTGRVGDAARRTTWDAGGTPRSVVTALAERSCRGSGALRSCSARRRP